MLSLRSWLVWCCLLAVCLRPLVGEEDQVDFATDLARIHIEMIGGSQKVKALGALRAAGTTHISGGALTFVLWAQRPDRVRVETIGGPVRITRGYDGVHPPWVRLGDTNASEQPVADAGDFIRDAVFDDPFFEPEKHGVSLHYEGAVTVAGSEWSRVLADSPSGSSVLYLDERYMLVRRDIQRVMRGRDVVEETYFSDFRPVGGVLMPYQIEVRVGTNVLHETTLAHVDANPFLLPGYFSMP